MNIRESSHGYWSSSRAFIWVATGACIGVGNIARLPYLMGEYGGWVFLLAYVAALLLLGLPLLVAEWALGRWMRDDIISGFERLALTANASRRWRWLGRFALIGAAMVLSYYSVIAGWSLGYTFRAASGSLGGDASVAADRFLQLAQDPERTLAWHTLFMVMTCVIVAQGFREGMQRAARYFVPAAFVVMTLVALASTRYGDPAAALDYVLQSEPARFGWRGAIEAIRQAFFTLALGFGAMITLGAYLPASVPLVRMGLTVILLDTLFSLLAGLLLLSFTLKAGLDPAADLSSIFQAFPQTLPEGFIAVAIATPFYFVFFLVTLLSAAALLEPLTRYLMERLRLTRVFAAASATIMVWYLGLGSLLSFNALQDLRLFDQNFFEWMQFLSTTLIAPLGGLLICFLASRTLGPELARALWGAREPRLYGVWRLALRFPARLALIALLVYATGLFDWLDTLWSAA